MSMRWTEEELEEYKRRIKGAVVHSNDSLNTAANALREFVEDETKPRRGGVTPPAVTVPTEEEEQITLFEWAGRMNYTYPDLRWLYHVPNGGSRGKAEAGRFKAMGVRKGVPDVALDIPRGGLHGLRIEMKRRDGGKLSDAQREWIDHYNAIGYRAVVCHGWQEAAKVIEEYLKGEGTP